MFIDKFEEICDGSAENGLIQLKGKDVANVREYILDIQDNKCALCENPITDDSCPSLDHQHKLKSNPSGPDGDGLIRGVLCRQCNVWEGAIWNQTTRHMQPKSVKERIELLSNLIAYYESETYPIIHPSEKPKEQKVSKRNYNKLKKVYSKKRKFPEYPKSGKLTIVLSELFEEYQIEPYN